MTTLSIEVDETVENYLKDKKIDTVSYLEKLIKEDMLLNEIKQADESGYTLWEE